MLSQVADIQLRTPHNRPSIQLLFPENATQQRGFTRPITAHKADFCVTVDGALGVVQECLITVTFGSISNLKQDRHGNRLSKGLADSTHAICTWKSSLSYPSKHFQLLQGTGALTAATVRAEIKGQRQVREIRFSPILSRCAFVPSPYGRSAVADRGPFNIQPYQPC